MVAFATKIPHISRPDVCQYCAINYPSTNGFVVPSGELMKNNVNLYSVMEHKRFIYLLKTSVLDFCYS